MTLYGVRLLSRARSRGRWAFTGWRRWGWRWWLIQGDRCYMLVGHHLHSGTKQQRFKVSNYLCYFWDSSSILTISQIDIYLKFDLCSALSWTDKLRVLNKGNIIEKKNQLYLKQCYIYNQSIFNWHIII